MSSPITTIHPRPPRRQSTLASFFFPLGGSSPTDPRLTMHQDEDPRSPPPTPMPPTSPASDTGDKENLRASPSEIIPTVRSRSLPPSPLSPTYSPTQTTTDNPPTEKKNTSKRSSRTIKKEESTLWPLSERLRPVLILENSGSTARDHLASERTFLAYVRTSLALASMGVALVQLFTIADLTSTGAPSITNASTNLRKFARPLGATTVLIGIIVLVIGFFRYFTVQTALIRGVFPTARSCIVFITFVLSIITTIVFGVLLSGRTK
ncbi:hypothetical protein BDQ12DRAFT_675863 [Crucibulum laeve]|uniref:DUF202 domain-containing protein n=1 Tax=Crucibulum laeve TaxID=68775 RepID=A0A5C3MF30_9AGAR|nr:hypothetical protein BDQ12DRAFT_675863 [Crucibulum laeve]